MRPAWLNRTVIGTGLTSLLADLSYESVLSILPGFLTQIGAGPQILGTIEGAADALASFVKLGSGWFSDRIARRKPIAVFGYLFTGLMPALMAIAMAWPLVMVARLVGWFGKGIRGPARDALLAASISPENRGKAFGIHRAADTVGAVIGPLLAAWLLTHLATTVEPSRLPALRERVAVRPGEGKDSIAAKSRVLQPSHPTPLPQSRERGAEAQRTILWLAVIPGVGAALALWLLVKEQRPAEAQSRRLFESVRVLPAEFRRYLVAVGLFGAGDFSHTLLIFAAIQALTPSMGTMDAAKWGALLYALRHAAAAVTAFPVGALSDRLGRRGLLAAGYFLAALVMVAFGIAVATHQTNLAIFAALFALAGVYIAVEETLEGATAADLVPDPALRGTAFGTLGVVNGLGDFLSSVIVGWLSVWSPIYGFGYAAVVMSLGATMMAIQKR